MNPDLKAIKDCGHKTVSNSPSPWLPCLLYISNHHNLHNTVLFNSILPKWMQEPSFQVHNLFSRNYASCATKKRLQIANDHLRKHQVCWPPVSGKGQCHYTKWAHSLENYHRLWCLMRERAQDGTGRLLTAHKSKEKMLLISIDSAKKTEVLLLPSTLSIPLIFSSSWTRLAGLNWGWGRENRWFNLSPKNTW